MTSLKLFGKCYCTNDNNCRGNSLLNSGYNIYAEIITNKLNILLKAFLIVEQSGFRRRRSCMDSVFAVWQRIGKHREYNRLTYIAFIAYGKLFNKLNKVKLWDILGTYGIP